MAIFVPFLNLIFQFALGAACIRSIATSCKIPRDDPFIFAFGDNPIEAYVGEWIDFTFFIERRAFNRKGDRFISCT